MHGAAVIPDHKIAHAPAMHIYKLRLGGERDELLDKLGAFGLRPADDVRGVRGEIEALASRGGMGSHNKLRRRWKLAASIFVELAEANFRPRIQDAVFGDGVLPSSL